MESYITILRFAAQESFVTLESLHGFIYKNSLTFFPGEEVTIHNITLRTFFRTFFEDEEGNSPEGKNPGKLYYLKPEALGYLLSYESLEQARMDSNVARKEALEASRQSTKAIRIAIVSLVLASLLALIQIIIPFL